MFRGKISEVPETDVKCGKNCKRLGEGLCDSHALRLLGESKPQWRNVTPSLASFQNAEARFCRLFR